jgi:hypothetical protein
VTQPAVPEFDTDELLTATKLNQLGAAIGFVQAVDGTYTPALTATGATPALGASGYSVGKWWRVSNHMHVIVDLLISGAGASIVGTSWRVSLPFVADLTFHAANILNATSDAIGPFYTRSSTNSQDVAGMCLLSGPAGTDTTGDGVIFYYGGTATSLGSADFTTTARIKFVVSYVADPTAF